MTTAIAATPGLDISGSHGQLLRTAAYSLKSLLRTDTTQKIGCTLANLPPIETFVCSITSTLGIKTAVLVTALIYVERLSRRLPASATGTVDTPYRIFLAALLLADKFWSDHAVPIKSLVAATGGVFPLREISNMERALIKLLGFNLFVSADQVQCHAKKLGFDIQM
ncbi:hypothetical protein GGI25_006071 [Coemansia spiralis]|uniref:Cyclin N-terminal domain-containing protein n=2 Tax=Coemansia TaxID=4863 RepID=A0A9W8G223_9FUNG|nr:hypothetical protein BX070DRAFT_229391 [Coemansia spiralis]KAJ1989431.1 hypothetical protein EDC05_004689 [Coemansia umbellata]KAJ2620360.1 hypothetical protein GGI26_005069 [Coemansia sp. RSA 1358]KAJ2669646.1 hypothetical protein GGI25_006071 [Coemansia spiralis]